MGKKRKRKRDETGKEEKTNYGITQRRKRRVPEKVRQATNNSTHTHTQIVMYSCPLNSGCTKRETQSNNCCSITHYDNLKVYNRTQERERARRYDGQEDRRTFWRRSLLRTRPHSLAPVLEWLFLAGASSTQHRSSKRSHTEFRLQSVTTISVILTSQKALTIRTKRECVWGGVTCPLTPGGWGKKRKKKKTSIQQFQKSSQFPKKRSALKQQQQNNHQRILKMFKFPPSDWDGVMKKRKVTKIHSGGNVLLKLPASLCSSQLHSRSDSQPHTHTRAHTHRKRKEEEERRKEG